MQRGCILAVWLVLHSVVWAAPATHPARENWNKWHDSQPDYTTRGTLDAEYQPPSDPVLAQWTDRLIPLPKEVSIKGADRVVAGRVALLPPSAVAPAVTGASNTISAFAKGVAGDADVTIKMMLTGDSNPPPSAISKRLAGVPNNRDQAYAIVGRRSWWRGRNEILLAANQPIGLVYAARTLTQLIRPGTNVTAETVLEIPRMDMLDWPDLRQRTFPSCGGPIFDEWLARVKVNAFQINTDCPVVKTNGEIEVVMPGYVRQGQLLRVGAEWGMPVIPTLAHIGGVMEYHLLKDQGAQVAASPFKGLLPVAEGTNTAKGYCPSNPDTLKLVTEWLAQTARCLEGYGDEISAWLTEENTPRCYCAKCRELKAQGLDTYEIEAQTILNAFAAAKRKYPRLRLALTLTQGSFNVNDRIAKLVMDGPPDVSLVYYDGGRTYCSDRKPMIYPVLEEFARGGRGLGVFPTLANSWLTTFPFTAPQMVRYRCQEFADKQMDSIAGYMVLSQKWYFEFNIMAMAEWGWNAHGRTPAEFARAYATVTGKSDPELFARWALKAGEAGWSLAQSRLLEALIWKPDVLLKADILLAADERRQALFELTNIREMKDLPAALADARDALALARQANDPRMRIESECTLAALEIYDALGRLVKPMSATNRLDAAARQTIGADLDAIDHSVNRMREHMWEWGDIINAERNFPPERPVYERHLLTLMGPLIMSDFLREKAEKLNIPDPRPETRFTPVGQWSAADFAAAKQAEIACDLSERVPIAGGVYHVSFVYNGKKAANTMIGGVALAVDKPDGSTKSGDPAFLPVGIGLGEYFKYAERQVRIPARAAGDKLMLRARLIVPEIGQDSQGEIGIRRYWEPGYSPWDDAR